MSGRVSTLLEDYLHIFEGEVVHIFSLLVHFSPFFKNFLGIVIPMFVEIPYSWDVLRSFFLYSFLLFFELYLKQELDQVSKYELQIRVK